MHLRYRCLLFQLDLAKHFLLSKVHRIRVGLETGSERSTRASEQAHPGPPGTEWVNPTSLQ